MSACLRWFKTQEKRLGYRPSPPLLPACCPHWSCSGLAEEIWPLKPEFPVSLDHLYSILQVFWKEIYSTVRCFVYSIKDLTVFAQVNGGLMQTLTCYMEAMLWLWIRSNSTAALERLLHWISHFSRPFEIERYFRMAVRIRIHVQWLCWKGLWFHQTHSHPKTLVLGEDTLNRL